MFIETTDKLVLHFNGADGATTFTDSSTYGNIPTAVDNAQLDTAQKVFGESSLLLDGTNDICRVPYNSELDFGSADICIDFRFRVADNATNIFLGRTSGASSYFYFGFEGNLTAIRLRDYGSGGAIDLTWSGLSINTNTWYHLALTRSGSSFRLFIDGVLQGTAKTNANPFVTRSAIPLDIGAMTQNAAYFFSGHIDELRISVGEAVWTSDFTPPTEEYTIAPVQLTPSLEWTVFGTEELSPSLEWNIDYTNESMLNPNIINHPFRLENVGVNSIKNTTGFAGCLAGYSYYLDNSGSSGQTIIELYVNSVLTDTKTITANNTSVQEAVYFDMDTLVYPGTMFEVRITEVAVGATVLNFNTYFMSFPFNLELVDYLNIKNSVVYKGINGQYLFRSADSWVLEFNQPIKYVDVFSKRYGGSAEVSVTPTITTGKFYNNRLVIDADSSTDLVDFFIKVKDLNNNLYTLEISPGLTNYGIAEVNYTQDTLTELYNYLNATYYQFSFDGITYNTGSTISDENTVTIDFSSESTGQKTVYLKFQTDNGEIIETVPIYFVIGDISCDVQFLNGNGVLTYSDLVPLQKVDIYQDSELYDSVSLNSYSGFSTVTQDYTGLTLAVSSGTLSYRGVVYSWAGSTYNITETQPGYYVVYLGLNRATLEIEYLELSYDEFSRGTASQSHVLLWEIKYIITQRATLSYESFGGENTEFLFIDNSFALPLQLSGIFTITVVDILGREKEFTYNNLALVYNTWKTLTVTDSEGNEILPGQIHQESDLTYTVVAEDWSEEVNLNGTV